MKLPILSFTFAITLGSQAWSLSPLGDHKTAVLLVNYSSNPVQEITVADAKVKMASVDSFYKEVSYGKASQTFEVFGWFTVNLSATVCDMVGLAGEANAAATASGVNLAQFTQIVYMFPYNSGCFWSGGNDSGPNGEDRVFINSTSRTAKVIAHELGHRYSLFHSDSLDCGSESLSIDEKSCAWQSYGDQADAMGNRFAHFNAFQKERAGYLNTATTPPITTVTANGQYNLDVYETNTLLPKALKIRRGTDTNGSPMWFYIEYRQAIGFDASLSSSESNLNKGILVRSATEKSAQSNLPVSFLLDMTPNSSSVNDAYDVMDGALEVGKSFTDPKSGITVSLISADSTGAKVDVKFGVPSQPPSSLDTVAPSVSITSPANGAKVSANSVLTISAAASDNIAVTRVDLYVNNSKICSDAVSPYSCSYAVPKGNDKTYTIEAKAFDAAGNMANHQISVISASVKGRR